MKIPLPMTWLFQHNEQWTDGWTVHDGSTSVDVIDGVCRQTEEAGLSLIQNMFTRQALWMMDLFYKCQHHTCLFSQQTITCCLIVNRGLAVLGNNTSQTCLMTMPYCCRHVPTFNRTCWPRWYSSTYLSTAAVQVTQCYLLLYETSTSALLTNSIRWRACLPTVTTMCHTCSAVFTEVSLYS